MFSKTARLIQLVLLLPMAAFGEDFNLTIKTPMEAGTVGRDVPVFGSAKLGNDQFLWVLARDKRFGTLWWPQSEVQVPSSGKWSSTVVLGEPRDVGNKFDVGVAVFDRAGHEEMKKYWTNAMKTGEWRPIQIPRPAAIETMTLKK